MTIEHDRDVLFKTSFNIISGGDGLPFDYEKSKDGLFTTTASELLIDSAEDAELIKVIKRKIPYYHEFYSGRPEPILNGEFKILQPSPSGEHLDEVIIGDYKCVRCGEINHIEQKDGKKITPFECQNDECGRKSGFTPLFPEELLKPIWKLPFDALETSAINVYEDIYKFIKEYLVIQEEEYHLMTLWIMASHLVDDFKTVPYLLFIAPKESGKSQAMRILSLFAYRAFLAASVTPSALFRAIELWKITLLIDEAETQIQSETESGQALYQTLNMGYKRDSYAIRVEGESRIPTRFDVFGFKAIASTKIFLPTLESRSIIINMSQGKPKKIIIDEQRADVIRSELLYFRFRTVGKLPVIQPKSNSGRIIEIMTPLFTVAQIFKGLNGIKTIISYEKLQAILNDKITDLENIRNDEEHGSVEAQVIEEIQKQIKQSAKDAINIPIKLITMGLGWVDEYSDPKQVKIASAKIGRVLKVMGIISHRTGTGFVIEHQKYEVKERIDKAIIRYIKDDGVVDDGDSQRDRLRGVMDLIRKLQHDNKGSVPIGEIILGASDVGIKNDVILDMIVKLKSSGDVIEVSQDRYRVI